MDLLIDEETYQNIEDALGLEWLETDGTGGYASSTILNSHTRRYHGLLVCNLKEPPGRYVLLSKFEDSLVSREGEFFLSCHRYPGVFFPEGQRSLVEFRMEECPHFIYRIGSVRVHKRVMLIRGDDRVLVRYSCEGAAFPFTLRLKPLIAFRGHHELSRENLSLHVKTYGTKNGFKIQPYDGMPPLFIRTNRKGQFYPSPLWYRQFEYDAEAERGFEFREDLFQPGVIEIPLKEGREVMVSASIHEFDGSLKVQWDSEEKKRRNETKKDEAAVRDIRDGRDREITGLLVKTGRGFLIRTPADRPTVIAGYHWFGDWGRDTFIALPGLTFCSGRAKEGIAILRAMAGLEKKGLLPNFINEQDGVASYNSADSALWYVWAVQQMLKYTADPETVKNEFWPVMKNIIKHYMAGTDFHIGMDENGLLHAGDETMQITWMDVSIAGKPVTPRSGYAVDINALWINALCFADELAAMFGDNGIDVKDAIRKAKESFNQTFWIEDGRYLGDVFGQGRLDPAVRPNQILAVSLPYPPLEPGRWQGVVDKVSSELLIPLGLRTLSPHDRAYRGRYAGGPASRDYAYHQGTAWPWLLAHFGEAFLRVAKDKEAARDLLRERIGGALERHLREAGLGFVSEVFDGDPPHRPNGCIAQAWSSGELIRLLRILNDL